MDQKNSILICVGAATAANCIPCFEHYLKQAKAVNLSHEEIQEALDLASKVKNGAHMVFINHVRDSMGAGERKEEVPCSSRSGEPCCG